MAPTPEEFKSVSEDWLKTEPQDDLSLNGDKIVISGMSGLYPQSHNLKEFSDILYNKVNPVSDEGLRWNYKHPELTHYTGMAPDLDRFDAQFFSVHYRLGNYMDPMSRKILEQSYQALYDAGLSPAHLNGKQVAVFIGTSYSDSEKKGFFNNVSKTGMGILGTSKTMFANRVSYWLNTKGPSLAIDEADCSTTTALEQAYLALKRGACEAAIVGGTHLCLHPQSAIHHGRLTETICQDGKTKSFSEDSDGFVLSDAIGVVLLQKAKDALRCYAELVHVKNEFISVIDSDMGPKYGYCRNPQTTAEFIQQFYKELQVEPQAVEFVEGYGLGLPDADKCELEAIEEVYCKNRDDPVLVGSVSSNVGVTSAASGMTALTKVLLGYHTGKMAANLYCSQPRQDVVALREGRMRVVTEHLPFQRTYVAVNGMSATGVNSHMLLCGHYKPKDLSKYKCSIPRLVTISGRQDSNIKNIFEDLKSRPIDAEELALFHSIHAYNISGHLGRGYTILDTDESRKAVSLCEKAMYFDDARRPLWFVYSGMGSQWAGMGVQLMRIPIFAAAIERCHEVLKHKGLDITHIITSTEKTIFDNILHSFVGIAAIQIGLTDVLRELGLKPDGIIGHSVGELGCAYADGCLSAEEMILCAYSRGLVSLQTPLIRGSMAAVGMGYKQISKLCPPEIDVACRNGPDSSTISGPADVMREFVADLSAKGIFAKEVPCSNIAYHSRYIANAGPNLLQYLKDVIKNPKPRSERWLSTSVPQGKWHEASSKYCSAEYQTNNLLNPVLFEETSQLVPSGAVLVEVAPHGLLQAILKRALPTDCKHVPLTRRGHPDNALFLLQAVGDLYMYGYTPKVDALYPKVQFPVSTGTPMLSHLVEWMHDETWEVSSFDVSKKISAATCKFVKSIHDVENNYLRGHVVRAKMCYPFAGALVAVWDMLAMYMGEPKRNISVQFNNVYLYAQPTLHEQRPLRLAVALHRGTGHFEIMSEQTRVATGYIFAQLKSIAAGEFSVKYAENNDMVLNSQDVYQLLRDRDYMYSGEFQSIEAANASLTEAALEWRDNWVTFIDGLLQLNALRQPHSAVSLPTSIRKMCINVKEHVNDRSYHLNGKTVMKADVIELCDYTRCGGVLLHNVSFRNLPTMVTQDVQRLNLIIPTTKSGNANNQEEANSVQEQKPVTVRSAVTLECSKIGDLESLHWVEAPQLEQADVPVTVYYAGLSMTDVKKATGVTPCDYNNFGMDYSGITKSGERVMGLVRCGAASSVVRAQPQLLWPVPAHWSLEDAATVPLAYAHAFYCLIIKGNMEPGMTILVHGGTGALGQAVIAVALAHKCQVFTTVSDLKKKKFLLKLYPQLKDEHIGNSRDASFADHVLLATHGEGCNLIISCVKGELKHLSQKCCASSGALIDTVQIQNQENYNFGMFQLTKNRTYISTDFSSIFTHHKHEDMKFLQTMLSEGIREGYVRPLSRVTYSPQDAARAFRLLAESGHRGRVLLCMQHSVSQAYPRIICNPDHCQLMFWDSGALGVQLADRLVSYGAKKLYINCTELTPYQEYKIKSWQKLGVDIVTSSENLSEAKSVTTVINDARRLGTLEGIYTVITKVSDDRNEEVLKSILNALDAASRLLCSDLKYFAVVSTVGALGQEVCLNRSKCGYVASSLDLSCVDKGQQASSRDAVDAIERALHSVAPVLVARPVRAQTPGLLQQFATLAGVNINNNDFSATLQELRVTDEKLNQVRAFLNFVCNVSLEEDEIPLLTLNRIRDLVNVSSEVTPGNVTGLATFFSYVETDELLATTDLVVLPTLDTDITLSDTEFDVNRTHLCIIPGMEGQHERFRELCERLKLPALVLQPPLDKPHETLRETAERYAEILMTKTKIQNNFYLLGYESGVLVALEVVSILEKHGLTGTVFCIGCSPEELQSTIEEQLSVFTTEEQLQDAVVRHMYTLMAGTDTLAIENQLLNASTWSQKVDACVRALLGRVPHTAQYVRALTEAALGRIKQAQSYKTQVRALRSRLVLMRAVTAHAASAPHPLQAHSLEPVLVHQLRSPLSYISRDMECSAIINNYLDASIHNTFEKKNLCESY